MAKRCSEEQRFWVKVSKTDTCWLWVGAVGTNGYGVFTWLDDLGRKRTGVAHRRLWIKTYGPIPDGLVLDHLCRVRNCVRLDHLELVTMQENSLRGETIAAKNAAKMLCKRGHALTLYENGEDRQRVCRTCKNEANKQYRARVSAR